MCLCPYQAWNYHDLWHIAEEQAEKVWTLHKALRKVRRPILYVTWVTYSLFNLPNRVQVSRVMSEAILDIQETSCLGAAWLDCPITKCLFAASLVAALHLKIEDRFKGDISVFLDTLPYCLLDLATP